KTQPQHQTLLAFHKELIRLRKLLPALRRLSKDAMDVMSFEEEYVLAVRRWGKRDEVITIFNFKDELVFDFQSIPYGVWKKRLDSSDTRWMGQGATAPDVIDTAQAAFTVQPYGVLLYEKEVEE